MSGLLTQEEADRLIEMLKKAAKETLYFPSGRGSISFNAVGEHKSDEFIINIDRKGMMAEKCTYQGRVYQNNQVLMRLDIDPNGRHTNPPPDGTIIRGSHLHIYSEEYGMRYAIPFDVSDSGLYELCFAFFQKFHIVEPPDMVCQESME